MALPYASPMTEVTPDGSLPRLSRYLLYWFAGCAILMVIAYTQLLDYYFDLGVDIRTLSFLERTAEEYSQQVAAGGENVLPSGPNLISYRSLLDLPPQIQAVFPLNRVRHGRAPGARGNQDFDDDDDDIPIDTFDLCPQGTCDLLSVPLFLQPGWRSVAVSGPRGRRQ